MSSTSIPPSTHGRYAVTQRTHGTLRLLVTTRPVHPAGSTSAVQEEQR